MQLGLVELALQIVAGHVCFKQVLQYYAGLPAPLTLKIDTVSSFRQQQGSVTHQ